MLCYFRIVKGNKKNMNTYLLSGKNITSYYLRRFLMKVPTLIRNSSKDEAR